MDESDQLTQTLVGDEEGVTRSPARSLWGVLLARIDEAFPLTCPICGGSMAMVAFITDTPVVRRIFDHIGESSTPPRIAPARGPPEWESEGQAIQQEWASGLKPEPEHEYDQRISW